MANFQNLSTELLSTICEFCDTSSILALRLTSRDIFSKTYYNFTTLLSSIKISFCQISLEILDQITAQPGIARKIQHITIGTESLDQFVWAGKPDLQITYDRLLREERDSRGAFLDKIRECLLRIPNLKTVRVEDRPMLPLSNDYRPSIGSTRIMALTGLNLRQRVFGMHHPTLRQWMFAVVFSLVRELKFQKMDVRLEMSMTGQDTKDMLVSPFDLTKALPRDAFLNHLKRLDVLDHDGRANFINGHIFAHPNDGSLRNLEELYFRGVGVSHFSNLFNVHLPNLKRVEIYNCTITGGGLNNFLRTNHDMLEFLSVSKVGSHSWEWMTFIGIVGNFLMLKTLHLEELQRVDRWRCVDVNCTGVNLIRWEGHEAIMAGINHLHQTMPKTYPLLNDLSTLIDLGEAHQVYLAAKQIRPQH
jgi:hypothetical protein